MVMECVQKSGQSEKADIFNLTDLMIWLIEEYVIRSNLKIGMVGA